jgi:hypothetical protein
MEVSDKVLLLKGAFTPFVLRPLPNGQYQMVGEAYVHGMMHGEWLQQPRAANGFESIELV